MLHPSFPHHVTQPLNASFHHCKKKHQGASTGSYGSSTTPLLALVVTSYTAQDRHFSFPLLFSKLSLPPHLIFTTNNSIKMSSIAARRLFSTSARRMSDALKQDTKRNPETIVS